MRIMKITQINHYNKRQNFNGIKVAKEYNEGMVIAPISRNREWAHAIIEREFLKIQHLQEKSEMVKKEQNELIDKLKNLKIGTASVNYDGEDVFNEAKELSKKIQKILQERKEYADDALNIAKNVGCFIDEEDAKRTKEGGIDFIATAIEQKRIEISKTSGLSKIAGYEKERTILEQVLVNKIKEEKQGKDVKIIDSILFFGPYGNGKTTITKAIAEETGCNIIPIKLRANNAKTQEKAMNQILETAQKAEENFQQNRTRTIIFIDEIEKLLNNNVDITEQFKNFIKSCSAKYHCSVFAATNHPSYLGLDVNEKNIFPIKVSIDPPDIHNAAKVFEHYLKNVAEGKINYEFLASELLQKGRIKEGKYNNQQIKNICYEVQNLSNGLVKEGDVLRYIKQMNTSPVLDKELLKQFENEYNIFIRS